MLSKQPDTRATVHYTGSSDPRRASGRDGGFGVSLKAPILEERIHLNQTAIVCGIIQGGYDDLGHFGKDNQAESR